jgi:predicted transcriptional regulator
MLDQEIRTAILELYAKGHGSRRIARLLDISRGAVRNVIASGLAEVPKLERAEKAEPLREEIVRLYSECKGNLVRVHEILAEDNHELGLSYQALTAFCRRHGIGKEPKEPAGHYDFKPGKEMQHDTSPHRFKLAGRETVGQTASLVLCYSRMRYIQVYPRFDRFTCKVFLQEGVEYFGYAAGECMVDNTNVVRVRGTGADMVPAPEMAAFAERLGFKFVAHEVGDANRSARVERPFHHFENNFFAGRKFSDWNDLNAQARKWCDTYNHEFNRHLHAKPVELFAQERLNLNRLPEWLPEVYQVHERIVDIEGFVSVHRHRYTVPYQLLDRQVQVRETKDKIIVYLGPRQMAVHEKANGAKPQRVLDPAHRPERGKRKLGRGLADKVFVRIVQRLPEAAAYATELKKRSRGRGLLTMRRLRRLVEEYPRLPMLAALRTAEHYGLYDLERLERMVLRNIAGDFFNLPDTEDDDEIG